MAIALLTCIRRGKDGRMVKMNAPIPLTDPDIITNVKQMLADGVYLVTEQEDGMLRWWLQDTDRNEIATTQTFLLPTLEAAMQGDEAADKSLWTAVEGLLRSYKPKEKAA